jgi:hypothetical protein
MNNLENALYPALLAGRCCPSRALRTEGAWAGRTSERSPRADIPVDGGAA